MHCSAVYVLWSETTVYSSYAIRAECAHSLSRLSQNGTSSSYTTMLCTLQWLKGLSKAKAKRAKKISQIFRYPSHLHICQWKRTIWNFLRIYINWIFEYQAKSWKEKLKNPKNCSKIAKKSLFFPLFGKKSFLNRTLGLRKSFLNQTTYVLKNRLYQQSFLNRDSFLNQAFLNRDSTVFLKSFTQLFSADTTTFFSKKNCPWKHEKNTIKSCS